MQAQELWGSGNMAEKVGFVTQGDASASGDIPEIGIGMLGYAFMGKAHSNAFKKIRYIYWPPPAIPKLIRIAGRTEQKVAEGAPGQADVSYTPRLDSRVNRQRV